MHPAVRGGPPNPHTPIHNNNQVQEIDANDGMDAWLTNGHTNNTGFLPEFDVPYTPSYLDNPLKNDLTFMSTGSLDHHAPAGSTHGTVNLHLSAGASASFLGPTPMSTDEIHPFAPDNTSMSIIDSTTSGSSSSSTAHHQHVDASYSKTAGMGNIGHLGTMAHTMDPAAIYSQQFPSHHPHQQQQHLPTMHTRHQQMKQEPSSLNSGQVPQPDYNHGNNSYRQPSQRRASGNLGSHSRNPSQDDMDYMDAIPSRTQTSDHHSIASDTSAGSTPDVHLQGLSSSGHTTDGTSNHTSPLVSSPENSSHPISPQPLQTHSPTPLPNSPPQRNGARGQQANSSSQSSSVAGENINNSNNGLTATLQSPTDVLLNINLYSGAGKKKTWPVRTVSLQSLHNNSLSYAQLLFHAANITTFMSVSIDGKDVPNAQPPQTPTTQTITPTTQHTVSIQDHSFVKSRIAQLREYAHQNGLASREHSGSSTGSQRSTQRSRRSTPTVNYNASGSLDFPPFEVTFQLPDTVKSCTRLGCMNLLVNKANRRACTVCQSQGAEINPNLLRRLVISPHHSAQQYAYLDQILEDFEYWKFDSVDDPISNSATAAAAGTGSGSGHPFPFLNQIGYYIAFIDSNTAAHVTRDFNTKVGYTPQAASGAATQQPNGNGNGFVTLNPTGPSSSTSTTTPTHPLMTGICEVDLNYTYAIKMKSHFWMLEVKPKPAVFGIGNKLKSKFYKKVGKPNQSRAAAAAALLAQQQQQVQPGGFNQMNDFGGNGGGDQQMMPFNRNLMSHKRRFEDTDINQQQPVANMLAVNHINHISINMPMSHGGGKNMNGNGRNMLMSGNDHMGSSRSGGATIEVINDTPEGPANTVHVSDSSFRVMKNQPVAAMMSVHDTTGAPSSSSSSSAAAAADSASSSSDTVDSKPLVGQPTPVVLVYRDMDAYQRDVLMNGLGGGGENGNNNGNGGNNGNNNFNSNGNGFNGNNFNGGNNDNGNNGGPSKRARFESNGMGGNGMGSSTFSMATVATPVLGIGLPGALPGLNAASMAGVAAAMNQFQLAQVAQAQMQQNMLHQVTMDYGRFQAPWFVQDRAAPSREDGDVAGPHQAGSDIELQPIGTADGDMNLPPKDASPGRPRRQSTSTQRRADEVDSNGDAMTFDHGEAKEDDHSQTHSSINVESQSGSHIDEHDAALDEDDPFQEDDQLNQVRVRIVDDESPEGRLKSPPPQKGQRFHAADVDAVMLIDEQAGMQKGKLSTFTKNVMDQVPVYQAFTGKGPASDFLRSFQFYQQSFWGMLTTLLLGLVAIIILIYNVRMPDESDPTAMKMQLIRWQDGTSTGQSPTQGGSGKWVVPPGQGRQAKPPQERDGPYGGPGHHEEGVFAAAEEQDSLESLALGVAVPKARSLADAFVTGNSTDTSDPIVLSRRLYASAQIFSSMRDVSNIMNTWAQTSPAVIANFLNPPPGSPAVVSVDVIVNNCNSAVKIGRGIGDYILKSNNMLAAYLPLATPPSLPVTLTSKDMCAHLTSGIGSIYMYQLTCQQWIAGNSLSINLPNGLSCASSAAFDASFTPAACEALLSAIKDQSLTNNFFTPYNTTVATGIRPVVYMDGLVTADVPPTRGTNNTSEMASPSTPVTLDEDADATMHALPYLAALSFYGQAADLKALCVNFNIINTIIVSSSSNVAQPPNSNSNDGPGGQQGGGGGGADSINPPASTSLLRDYHVNGLLLGLVALGALGMFFLLQMLIFVVIVGMKSLSRKARTYFYPMELPMHQPISNKTSGLGRKPSPLHKF